MKEAIEGWLGYPARTKRTDVIATDRLSLDNYPFIVENTGNVSFHHT